MVGLARDRLAPFGSRATVELVDGSPPAGEPARSVDRFLSTFVLDLLSLDDARAVVAEAHRMLRPGGLLGLASLTVGFDVATRIVAAVWSRLHAWSPALAGGCRGIELFDLLQQPRWSVRHVARLAPFAIPLEVVVAERIDRSSSAA